MDSGNQEHFFHPPSSLGRWMSTFGTLLLLENVGFWKVSNLKKVKCTDRGEKRWTLVAKKVFLTHPHFYPVSILYPVGCCCISTFGTLLLLENVHFQN
jgi:hypothetical protein